uniref:Uncharacterized protein n=1 Tax=Ananas comosus var. bracteatus TaxID=296719 RepID=A0A6V7NWR9_ANACO|nr:unnamed protein product [Ananas comosus var. bracteatus]
MSVHMPSNSLLILEKWLSISAFAHVGIQSAYPQLLYTLHASWKTQAEICKVMGLAEVTLRKVYKELLENWDDFLPANYTPAVPPEKAFPMTWISSARSSTAKADIIDLYHLNSNQDKDKDI